MKEVDYLTNKHKTASRSIETRRSYTTGTTHSTSPFYFSRIVTGDHYASIYNDNTPMQIVEAHYINGVETNKGVNHIGRGEAFSDGRIYDEGVTHYKSYMLLDYDKYLSGM